MLTKSEFKAATSINDVLVEKWYDPICTGFNEYIPYSGLRMAHFLAQLGHESMGFARTIENLNYSAEALRKNFPSYFPTMALAQQYARKPQAIADRIYANRMGNGPEGSGDGWKYRGHGLIQITGSDNTHAASKALGIPVDKLLGLLERDPGTAARASAWWIWENKAIPWMDKNDVLALSRLINRGNPKSTKMPFGYEDRQFRTAKALRILA